ncbi:hypothetical protein CANINC_003047 [Pichia inconspicua]|uniref:Serine/threonine-protein phosphatase n=1 Tax=Pichia inconspicua TaxID=52247 RepID=A0A4T0WZY5_9ASCO|nr:hypothetical protein CANINC_003047 [[Candida] inconspicua]
MMSTIEEVDAVPVNKEDSGSQKQVDIHVNNALRVLASRHSYLSKKDNKIKSISSYSPEEGKVYSTTERAIPDVVPPTNVIPTDDELFDEEGKPDYQFLMKHFKRQGKITEDQMIRIVDAASEIMRYESNILEVDVPATVVGDIHGQFYDLLGLIELYGDPKDTQYLFLGDYVDRGDRSIEVLILLYAIKINFPKTFWLMRGNHETERMTSYFTYKKECTSRFSIKLYNKSIESFKTLPLCAILNKQFFCVHAGISSHLWDMEAIQNIDRYVADFPSHGLFCDIMWSDPSPDYDNENIPAGDVDLYFKRNTDRHCSEFFSYRAMETFLNKNDLLSVVRGHQPQDSGYRIYKMNETTNFPSLITIFSAPNYCGTYGNMAAVLHYNGDTFNIKQFDSFPTPYFLPDQMNVFEWSLPFVAEKVVEILSDVLNVCTEDELLGETLRLNEKNYNAVEKHYRKKAIALATASEDNEDVEIKDAVVNEDIATSAKEDEELADTETESDRYLQTTSESDETSSDEMSDISDSGSFQTGSEDLNVGETKFTELLATDKTENNSSDVTDVEVLSLNDNETQVEGDSGEDEEAKEKNKEPSTRVFLAAKLSDAIEKVQSDVKTTNAVVPTKQEVVTQVDETKKPSKKLKKKELTTDTREKEKKSKRKKIRSQVGLIPHHLNKIQRKVGVVKRMNQLLQVLREERERVEEFTALKESGGMLIDGREVLARKLKSFTEARELDKDNEGLPPVDWKR